VSYSVDERGWCILKLLGGLVCIIVLVEGAGMSSSIVLH